MDVRLYADALGLARLLYALEAADGDPVRLPAIAAAGELLHTAVTQAKCPPGSLGYKAAPGNARKGLEQLLALPWPEGVQRLLEVARERLPRE